MPISNQLMKSIISIDSYNRSYAQGIEALEHELAVAV